MLDGNEVIAEHELDRHGTEQVVLNFEVLEVNELGMIASREGFSVGALFLTGRSRGEEDVGISHGINLLNFLGHIPVACPSEKMGR